MHPMLKQAADKTAQFIEKSLTGWLLPADPSKEEDSSPLVAPLSASSNGLRTNATGTLSAVELLENDDVYLNLLLAEGVMQGTNFEDEAVPMMTSFAQLPEEQEEAVLEALHLWVENGTPLQVFENTQGLVVLTDLSDMDEWIAFNRI